MTAHKIRSEGWYVQQGFRPVRRYKVTCICGEHLTDWNRNLAYDLYAIHAESPGFDDVFPGFADVESPFGSAP